MEALCKFLNELKTDLGMEDQEIPTGPARQAEVFKGVSSGETGAGREHKKALHTCRQG